MDVIAILTASAWLLSTVPPAAADEMAEGESIANHRQTTDVQPNSGESEPRPSTDEGEIDEIRREIQRLSKSLEGMSEKQAEQLADELAGLRRSIDALPPNSLAEREEGFKKALDGVVLRGLFQFTNRDGLRGKAPLGKPKPERYVINGVNKLLGDRWLVKARIQFADKDVPVPVPVRVIWSGDTPIITLDKVAIPMIGTYSARVMIFENFYGGVWTGSGYGGVLCGQIVKAADEERIIEKEKEGFDPRMPSKNEKEAESNESDSKE